MNPLARLVRLFRGRFRRRREDDETAEELRFHLEMEAEKNVRGGMAPGEARRRARLRLGGLDAIREAVQDARGGRPLEDLIRDIGYALRSARRNPGFTVAAVVSLAIPIGFNAAIFTVVDSMLFHPLPVSRPAQLVDVYTSDRGARSYWPNSYPDYVDLRAANDVFTDTAAHAPMRTVHVARSQTSLTGGVLLARIEGDAASAAADILREFRRMEPDLFFFFQGDTLREIADVTMLPFRIAASASGAAGIVAMLLGAVGLYGLIAYVVAGRTRELAIRSVLGARAGSLLRLVLASGAWVIVAGAGLGAVLAVLVTGLVSQLMPGIALRDPVVWGIALLLIAGVAAAAYAGPARRIVRLDLPQALHVE